MSDETRALGLDAIRARLHNLSPGPWSTGERMYVGGEFAYQVPILGASTDEEYPDDPDHIGTVNYNAGGFHYPHGVAKSDAEFMAAARQDVPALLDEIDRLNRIVAAMAKDAAEQAEHMGELPDAIPEESA